MMKLRSINSIEKPNISRMSARIPADNDFTFDDFLLNLVHIFVIDQFFPPSRTFGMTLETSPSVCKFRRIFLFSDLDKYLVGS